MKKQKITQSFEYKLLVKYVLFIEVIYLLIVLVFMLVDEFDGDGFLKYANLQKEGIQTIAVVDYSTKKEKVILLKSADDMEITTYRLECSTVLDEKEYMFIADAVDVIGKNSEKVSREYVYNKESVTGYLFSSHNREKLYFSYSIDDGWELFFSKAKKRFLLRYYGAYVYKIVIYFLTTISFICSLETRNKHTILEVLVDRFATIYVKYKIGIPKRKNRTLVAKDNYTNKAIKMNPEYKFYENGEFENEYSSEIVAVAEYIKCGDYRISAKQVNSIKEEFIRSGYTKAIKGPILSRNALGHDAILLRYGFKLPFVGKYSVCLIEKTMEGNCAERKFNVDYVYARNIPGNHVIVVNSDKEIGIYENTLNNENNQLLCNYDKFTEEMRFSKIGYYIQQVLLFIVSAIFVIMVWLCTRKCLVFPRVAFCLVTARTYKHMNYWLSRKYISQYGKTIYDNMYCKLWIILYYLLIIFVLIIVWIR